MFLNFLVTALWSTSVRKTPAVRRRTLLNAEELEPRDVPAAFTWNPDNSPDNN